MRVICPLTNVQFITPGFRSSKVRAEHPIFAAPLKDLVMQFPLYVEGKLTKPEERLLFVALLKYTGLVEFKSAATPSTNVIASNMEILIKTIDWSNKMGAAFKLPRYVVETKDDPRASTSSLKNIRLWIDAWWEARTNWIDQRENVRERTAFLIREESLNKLIHSSYKKVEDYAGRLAGWALDASETPVGLRDYWTKLFKLREPELYNVPTADLQELLDHLLEYIDPTSGTVAVTAINHIRGILKKNEQGIAYQLDQYTEVEQTYILSQEGKPYTIISRHERLQQEMVAETPDEEPVQHRFPTKVAYLIAVARWNIKRRIKEEEAAAQQAVIEAAKSADDEQLSPEQLTDIVLDSAFASAHNPLLNALEQGEADDEVDEQGESDEETNEEGDE